MIHTNFDDKAFLKKLLLEDKVIAFPTETVFGLGVISTSEKAFNNLVEVKRRSPDKPFTLMCSSLEQLSKYVVFSKKSLQIARKFMPGSITLILKVQDWVPKFVTLGSGFIGVRIPGNKDLCDFIEYVGVPLLVPSANKSGEAPALSSEEVEKAFMNEIPAVVDGKCVSNLPSTIVKIDNDVVTLIRQGPIDFDDIIKAGD